MSGAGAAGQWLRAVGEQRWPDGTVAGGYRFGHALYQQVLYGRVAAARRVRLHQHIGERVGEGYGAEAGARAAELALHFARGRDVPRAVQYLRQAGENASQRSAYVEAISHLAKGLELLKTLPDTPERAQQELTLYITLGPTLRFTKGSAAPEVEAAYQRARELCQQVGETPQLFPVLIGLVEFYINRREFQTARELAEHMLCLAQRVQDPIRLRSAHSTRGNALYFLGELDSARRYLEQGIASYQPLPHDFHGLGLRQGEVFGLSRLALILWELGYPDQALQRSQEALTLARAWSAPFSLATALVFAAELHCRRRAGQMTYEQAEAARVLSSEQGFALRLAQATILRGWALVEQGQEEAGVAQIRQGIAARQASGQETTVHLDLLVEALRKVGQIEEGLKVVVEVLAADNTTGQGRWAVELYRLQGELLLYQTAPDVAQAEACFHQARVLARRQQAKSRELRAAMSRARLWQRLGKHREARQLLAGVYNWFTDGFDTADLQEAKALSEALAAG